VIVTVTVTVTAAFLTRPYITPMAHYTAIWLARDAP